MARVRELRAPGTQMRGAVGGVGDGVQNATSAAVIGGGARGRHHRGRSDDRESQLWHTLDTWQKSDKDKPRRLKAVRTGVKVIIGGVVLFPGNLLISFSILCICIHMAA